MVGWHYSSYEEVVVLFPDGTWLVTTAGIHNGTAHVDRELFEDRGVEVKDCKIQRFPDVENVEALEHLTCERLLSKSGLGARRIAEGVFEALRGSLSGAQLQPAVKAVAAKLLEVA